MKRKTIMLFIVSLLLMMTASVYAADNSDGLIEALSGISEVYSIADDEEITWERVIDTAAELADKYSNTDNGTVTLLDKQILTSVPNLKEKPNASEISEVFVKVLGYDIYVTNDNYLGYAYELKLFNGISVKASETMTGEEFSKFLQNVLSAKVVEIGVSDTGASKTFRISDKTLLYDRYNVVKKTGIVTADTHTTLTGISKLAKEYIEIDGVEYLKGKTNPDKYLGQRVDFYYIDDEDEVDYTLIYIKENEKNKKEIIAGKNILSCENGYYEYEAEGSTRAKRIRLAQNASYIYNGIAAGVNSLSNDELIPKAGKVIVIDNNGDNSYDCVIIYDVIPVILKNADAENEKLVFDYGHTYDDKSSLALSDDKFDKEYKIINSELEEIAFEDLQPRSVVSVGKAKNGDVIIIASVLKGMGEITSIVKGSSVSMAGVEYDLSPYYERANTSELSLGLFGTFYFDFNYDIVGFVKEDAVKNMGYLVRAYTDDEDDTKVILKIFNISGVFEKLELADKISLYSPKIVKEKLTVEEKKVKKEEAVNMLETGTLIVYDVSGNKIRKIYPTIADDAMELSTSDYPVLLNKTVVNNGNKLQESRLYQGLMAGKYRVPKTTVIFSIPVDKSREDKFSIYYGSAFPSNGDKYFTNTVKFYNIDEYMKINVILEEKQNTSASVSASNDIYVVDKITSGINEDDQEVLQIRSLGEEGEAVLYSNDFELISSSDVWGEDVKITELKSGDVIQVSANEDGEINGFRVLFEGQNPGEYRVRNNDNQTPSNSTINDFALYYGKVTGVDDNAIIQNCVGAGNEKANNVAQLTDNIKNYPTSFYEFNTKTKKVRQITLNDIEENDEVMIRRTYTSVNVVYKVVK